MCVCVLGFGVMICVADVYKYGHVYDEVVCVCLRFCECLCWHFCCWHVDADAYVGGCVGVGVWTGVYFDENADVGV